MLPFVFTVELDTKYVQKRFLFCLVPLSTVASTLSSVVMVLMECIYLL